MGVGLNLAKRFVDTGTVSLHSHPWLNKATLLPSPNVSSDLVDRTENTRMAK